jgi:RNA polymerase sigma-70 factor (sigma-E family)
VAEGCGDMTDRPEFDAFVASRSPALLRAAYLMVHDHGLAEDLLQIALAKAWFAWSRVEGDPERYVRRVIFTTRASWWRRRWWREVPTADVPDRVAGNNDPDSSAPGHDLWVAIGRLPRRQRAVIVLRYYDDLTEKGETAQVLDCSVGTVKSQCAKALAKLRVDAALRDSNEVSSS